MNEECLPHTLDTRTGYCPKRRHTPPILASALIFVLFFAFGIALYLAIAPLKQDLNLPLAAERLSLLSATPTTAEGVFYLLLSATESEGLFLLFTFLLTFTFFAEPLTRALLAIRGLRVALLVCRCVDFVQTGVLSPAAGACFFICEAAFALICIMLAARSASLSQEIRHCNEHRDLLLFIHLISHLFHLLIAYSVTVFTAALLFLTLRL